MEADSQWRFGRMVALVGILVLLLGPTSFAASLRTQNFLITAPTPQLANAVAEAAERYRRDLAIHWLGQALTATLRALGVDTRHLVGGVQDWQAKSRPIEPLAAAADAG